jgi:pilus assembly protein Flp/PilA
MLVYMHERGQGLIEYALLIVLIAIVAIVVFLVIGPAVGNAFSAINSKLVTY